MGDAELFEQTGQPKVAHGKTLPASLIAQGAGEPCFATAGAGDEKSSHRRPVRRFLRVRVL